jgi:hypothetical protein
MKAFYALLAVAALLQATIAQSEDVEAENFVNDDEDLTENVIGGINTTYSQFIVRLLRNGRFVSTGVLISRQHVLASAVSIINPRDNIEFDPRELTAVVGLHTVNQPNRGSRAVRVADVQAHFNYLGRSNGFANNLAVITLQNPVRLNQAISPAQISRSARTPIRDTYIVSFGANTQRGNLPNRLQIAPLNVISAQQFRRANPRAPVNANNFYLTATNFNRGVARAVNSDTGAPILETSSPYRVAGLVSYNPSQHRYHQWRDGVGYGIPGDGRPGVTA